MTKEIERKFLVDLNKFESTKFCTSWTATIKQGYLSKEPTVRVRIENSKGFITIKGKTENITRDEFEYEIPLEDAEALLNLCEKIISKDRITVKYDHKYWTIDVFEDENFGLVLAEIELKDEDEEVQIPDWVIKEVSDDSRFYNVNLIEKPYKSW
jgi:CYTH domain-containing protein